MNLFLKQVASILLMFTAAIAMAMAAYYLVRTPRIDAHAQEVDQRLDAVERQLDRE